MNRAKLITYCLALLTIVALSVGSVVAQDEPLRVTLVINGVLGDKSFFDSAQRGVEMAMDDFDIEVNTIELGIDPGNWEPGVADAMSDSDSYDVLITGTTQTVDFVGARAHLYPDKVFVHFDAVVAYDAQTDEDESNDLQCLEGCTNVYSITYKQNEGSFLAGVYAAAISSDTSIDGVNEAVVIGAIGGQDIPVINDFIVGYEQGACLVNADSQVIVQYAGNWNDPARGKEISLAMFEQGADVIFQIAGGTGVGLFEAAAEQGRYAIGVDSDQATIIADTNPDQAERILTSMLKNVDSSLYRAIELYLNDELPLGSAEALGLAEGGVGLAINEFYDAVTPADVQDLVAAVTEAVSNGDIAVVSIFDPENPASVGAGCASFPVVELDFSAAEGS